jgi:hypothetical protein
MMDGEMGRTGETGRKEIMGEVFCQFKDRSL